MNTSLSSRARREARRGERWAGAPGLESRPRRPPGARREADARGRPRARPAGAGFRSRRRRRPRARPGAAGRRGGPEVGGGWRAEERREAAGGRAASRPDPREQGAAGREGDWAACGAFPCRAAAPGPAASAPPPAQLQLAWRTTRPGPGFGSLLPASVLLGILRAAAASRLQARGSVVGVILCRSLFKGWLSRVISSLVFSGLFTLTVAP